MTAIQLTDLQVQCDAFVIDRMTRLPDGDIVLRSVPDEWPAGASASDIAASYERVRAKLRRTPSPITVARTYRDTTPVPAAPAPVATPEPTVEIRPDEGLGGLTAALLMLVGAVIAAVALITVHYARTGELLP